MAELNRLLSKILSHLHLENEINKEKLGLKCQSSAVVRVYRGSYPAEEIPNDFIEITCIFVEIFIKSHCVTSKEVVRCGSML